MTHMVLFTYAIFMSHATWQGLRDQHDNCKTARVKIVTDIFSQMFCMFELARLRQDF